MKVYEIVYVKANGEIVTEIYKDLQTARDKMRKIGKCVEDIIKDTYNAVSVKIEDDRYIVKGFTDEKKVVMDITVNEKEVKGVGSYVVRVPVKTYTDVQVEAESEEDAKKIAQDSALWDEDQLLINCEPYGDAEIVKTRKVEVEWDVDDEDELNDLPDVVDVPVDLDDDDVADWLSDNYGYCVDDWKFVE